jgi:hypothetical protein
MEKLLSAGLVTMALLGVSSAGITGNKAAASIACGTTYSVAAEEGSLLLQHHGKFSLITVGAEAAIRDGKGHSLTLGDIHPGDWIEYWTESSAGKKVIRNISVNTGDHEHCSSPTVLGQR